MIRKYREPDLEALLRVWADASAVGHPFLSEAFLTDEREQIARVYLPNTETWIWEVDGRVGGFISLLDHEVGGLFVDPALHGRGIGRALVDHAVDARGELEVEVFEDNEGGRAFYRACGFVEIDTEVHSDTGLGVVRLKLRERPGDTSPSARPIGPSIEVVPLGPEHRDAVRFIYAEGIETGDATFETEVPHWEAWDAAHVPFGRLVAQRDGEVVGWAAMAAVSRRPVYAGVAEVSVYVRGDHRGMGVGTRLLEHLVRESEANGVWTLQAGIFPENQASLRAHQKCGFRTVGLRERIGMHAGRWRDVVLLERRSDVVGVDGGGPDQVQRRGMGRRPGSP